MMTKEDYLIDIHQAVLDRKRIYIILFLEETDEYEVIINSDKSTDLPSILSELPFTGRVYQEDVFPEWYDFVENIEETEIYGFELEDGKVQVAITPDDLIEKE
jgi:hypothetical protein